MTATASVFALNTTQASLEYYENLLQVYSARYNVNTEMLSKEQSLADKYEEYYETVTDKTKKVTVGKTTIISEDLEFVKSKFGNEIHEAARNYADKKTGGKFKQELLDDLTEKDINYTQLKTTCEAMIEMLKAQRDAQKTQAQQDCAYNPSVSQ